MRSAFTHAVAASLGFWAAIALWRFSDRTMHAPAIERLTTT